MPYELKDRNVLVTAGSRYVILLSTLVSARYSVPLDTPRRVVFRWYQEHHHHHHNCN